MGSTRTSMKDVLNAIEAQNATLTALVAALAPKAQEPVQITPEPVIETVPVTEPVAQAPEQPRFEQRYLNHMDSKVSKLVKADGQARVLYARRNLAGEFKLAYCLKDRWAGLKDNGKLGAIKIYE